MAGILANVRDYYSQLVDEAAEAIVGDMDLVLEDMVDARKDGVAAVGVVTAGDYGTGGMAIARLRRCCTQGSVANVYSNRIRMQRKQLPFQ